MFLKPVTPLLCTTVILAVLQLTSAGNVAVRIVRETAPYGIFGSNFQLNPRDQVLVAKSKPGKTLPVPSHLKRLLGKLLQTFQLQTTVTPSALLKTSRKLKTLIAGMHTRGYWACGKVGQLTNGTFASMIYAEGVLLRSQQAFGSSNINMRKPQFSPQCQRAGNDVKISPQQLQTPLVCSDDALLVYPRLNATLRQRWNDVESQRFNDEAHAKGLTRKELEQHLPRGWSFSGYRKKSRP
uniref:Putative secreted protein n=1 Tax=Ixodes ricinus TaxID=34613 RepID=A0A090XAW1_IXORI